MFEKMSIKVNNISKWISTLVTPSLLTVLIAFVYNYGGQRAKDEQKMFNNPEEKYRTVEAVKEFAKSGMTSIDGYKLDERIDSIYERGREWHHWRSRIDSIAKSDGQNIKRNAVTSYQNGKKLDSILKILSSLSNRGGASIYTQPNIMYYTSKSNDNYTNYKGGSGMSEDDFIDPELQSVFDEFYKTYK